MLIGQIKWLHPKHYVRSTNILRRVLFASCRVSKQQREIYRSSSHQQRSWSETLIRCVSNNLLSHFSSRSFNCEWAPSCRIKPPVWQETASQTPGRHNHPHMALKIKPCFSFIKWKLPVEALLLSLHGLFLKQLWRFKFRKLWLDCVWFKSL